ncbi:hypothetical protein SCHPADRAFT_22236 [Schizopora paradoxa]|uniref:Uncharacterized protein n=1 Tax=Schizopora paradoxa TaxID=27342 RepID=A0A0H2SFZ4_9AGAM|nr:hypothetical protein SCHPADRAFT_22236 [Schizopora paradoxa]
MAGRALFSDKMVWRSLRCLTTYLIGRLGATMDISLGVICKMIGTMWSIPDSTSTLNSSPRRFCSEFKLDDGLRRAFALSFRPVMIRFNGYRITENMRVQRRDALISREGLLLQWQSYRNVPCRHAGLRRRILSELLSSSYSWVLYRSDRFRYHLMIPIQAHSIFRLIR